MLRLRLDKSGTNGCQGARRAPERSGLRFALRRRAVPRPASRTARTTPPTLSATAPASSLARSARRPATAARRRTLQHRFAARGEHGLERLDPVVGRLEKKIVDRRLRLLELADQRLCVPARRHRAAQLRRHPVPARLPQDHELPLLRGLDEVLRLAPATLAPARPSARFAGTRRSAFRLETLRCFHEINQMDRQSRRPSTGGSQATDGARRARR
jgi:hypothetical protein